MKPRVHILVGAGLCLALTSIDASCGDDDLTPTSFSTSYVQTYCDYLFRCCQAEEHSFGAKSQCTAATQKIVDELFSYTSVAGAQVAFVGSAARTCLDALAGADCTQATATASCLDTVTAPSKSAGDECRHNTECKSYDCVLNQGQDTGVCASSPPNDGACDIDDRTCGAGQYCASSKRCEARAEAGKPCGSGAGCLSGVCSPSTKTCNNPPAPVCNGK